MKRSLLLALLLLSASLAGCLGGDEDASDTTEEDESIKGCTYAGATNYNADATEDDGSCTFANNEVEVIKCDDGNQYTGDNWNATSEQCEFSPRTGETCDDGFSGTEGDTVDEEGECKGVPKDCDDGNPYTDDDWDAASEQCVNYPRTGETCDDADNGTWNDMVDDQGICAGEIIPICDDGNDGTEDSFNLDVGECEYIPKTGPCDDGDPNTSGEYWQDGSCIGGVPLDCDDGIPWTNDLAVDGVCVNDPIEGMECDDGDELTRNDVIEGGYCIGQPNLLPMVNGVMISPEFAFITTDLVCSYDYQDENGDADSSITYWYIDGIFAGTGPVLSSGQATNGSLVECIVFANDGVQSGNNESASLTIQNSPPVIDSVILTPNSVNEGETLICTVNKASDADGDALNYTFMWFVNDVLVAGENTESFSTFVSGDEVRCEAIADDGKDGSAPAVSNTVTVS